MPGTSEVSEDFTTAPGHKSTNGGDTTAPGTTSEGRAGMEIGALKHFLTAHREANSSFY